MFKGGEETVIMLNRIQGYIKLRLHCLDPPFTTSAATQNTGRPLVLLLLQPTAFLLV